MQVRVQLELLSPGVQNREKAQTRIQVSRIAPHLQQRLRHSLEE